MSDTPRTDAASRHREGLGLESGKVCSDFARELERELAQRTAERDSTNAHFLDAWRERADFARELERELAQRTAEVAKATAQRNAALDAREITQRTLDGIDGVLSQRTAERDEARRLYCEARYREERADLRSTPTSPHVIAAERGWDCFAPHANTTDVPVQNGGET